MRGVLLASVLVLAGCSAGRGLDVPSAPPLQESFCAGLRADGVVGAGDVALVSGLPGSGPWGATFLCRGGPARRGVADRRFDVVVSVKVGDPIRW